MRGLKCRPRPSQGRRIAKAVLATLWCPPHPPFSSPSGSKMNKSVDQATRLAALGDLRQCLKIADEIGVLEVIEDADPHLEMGALYELSLQKPVPPVLLFRKIKGYPDNHRV